MSTTPYFDSKTLNKRNVEDYTKLTQSRFVPADIAVFRKKSPANAATQDDLFFFFPSTEYPDDESIFRNFVKAGVITDPVSVQLYPLVVQYQAGIGPCKALYEARNVVDGTCNVPSTRGQAKFNPCYWHRNDSSVTIGGTTYPEGVMILSSSRDAAMTSAGALLGDPDYAGKPIEVLNAVGQTNRHFYVKLHTVL